MTTPTVLLSEESVKTIQTLARKGFSVDDIRKMTGVSRPIIKQVLAKPGAKR